MKEIKYTILYCVFVETFVIPFYYCSGTVLSYFRLRFLFHNTRGSAGKGRTNGIRPEGNNLQRKVRRAGPSDLGGDERQPRYGLGSQISDWKKVNWHVQTHRRKWGKQVQDKLQAAMDYVSNRQGRTSENTHLRWEQRKTIDQMTSSLPQIGKSSG